MSTLRIAIIITGLLLVACDGNVSTSKPARGRMLDTGLSKVQSLDIDTDGLELHILVAGLADNGSTHAYNLRSSDAGRNWHAPVRVDVEQPAPHKPARNIDPQVAVKGRHVIAAWQIPGSGWGDYGPISTAHSTDGGITWQPGTNPADDGSNGDHGFIDLTADAIGRFHAVWLDSRNEQRGLRYSYTENLGMNWVDNETIDGQTCECCWNRISAQGQSLYVAYRGQSPRDIHIAVNRGIKPVWSENQRAGEFDWQFKGCPHAGAGLATVAKQYEPDIVHTTVWTGKDGEAGLYYVRSLDAGKTWQTPVLLDGPKARHSDITARGNRVAAVWDGAGRENPHIVLVRSNDQGTGITAPEPLHCEDNSRGSHPRIVATAEGYLVLWTTEAGNLCAVTVQ